MPIYEFLCPDNNKIYTFFARSLAYSAAQPRCPDNPAFRMERMLSSFSVTGRAQEESDVPVHDPNLDIAITEMEREFDSMGSDNPDPRQVARMMRTMTRLTGERMPEQLEEVMRRLEAGEKLDKLEEELGKAADTVGAEPSDEAALVRCGEIKAMKERLRAARLRPVRDPVLYEMSEYADVPAVKPTETGTKTRDRKK